VQPTAFTTDNFYFIINYDSHKCLEIGGGSLLNGVTANQWDCVNGGPYVAQNQHWLILP
jgi:hypothetical protein